MVQPTPFDLKIREIGKLFVNLLDKQFPPHSKLNRLFNRTSAKISYSCMSNMNSYSYVHNHKALNCKPNETGISDCNCRNKDTCPLPNSCQTKWIIDQVNIVINIGNINKNATLAHIRQHLKIVLGIIKSR